MIIYSERESALFGFKFGRYEGELKHPELLLKEIKEGGYDFVRIKVLNADEDLFLNIEKTGLPYRLLDIHRYYTLDFTKTPLPKPADSPMQLVRNEGGFTKQVHQLVTDTFTELPMGFFRYNEIEEYFPKELQLQNLAEYISTRYQDVTNPGKQAWVITYNGEAIGCSSTEFKGVEAYTTYIGLLPQYRQKSHYAEVIRQMQYLIQEAGCQYCTGSSRLHNLASQAVFEREGERYSRHDYVFMLMPRLKV